MMPFGSSITVEEDPVKAWEAELTKEDESEQNQRREKRHDR